MPVFLSPTLRQHQTLLLLNWMKNDVYKTIKLSLNHQVSQFACCMGE